MFSERTAWHEHPNRIALELAEKKKTGESILDLTLTNPTLCAFSYASTPPFASLDRPENLVYEPDAMGLLSARQAVARYYAERNARVSEDRIVLTSSTSEAYSFLFRLLGGPGDTVLAPKPGYPLFDYLCQLSDLKLEKYALSYEGFWSLGERALLPFVKTSPKALIFVNPGNPTGNFAGDEERRALNAFAAEHGTALIADEVFLDFSWTPGRGAASFAGNKEVLTFTLSGISKILGLPQMKLSWIAIGGPEKEAREAARRLEVIADTYLSVNTPAQRALPGWLEASPAAIGEILSRVKKNYASLRTRAASRPDVEVLHGEGGWHAVVHIRGSEDETLCLELLREKNLLVHPGYLFDLEREGCLVVSLLLPCADFEEGIERLLP